MKTTDAPLISIIVPCYNEQDNIGPFFAACAQALPSGYDYELVFVDDGSLDSTVEVIRALKSPNSYIRVKVVELARNFGKEIAVTAGLHEASGDAAVMVDADMQHPPVVIGEFLTEWQKGADIVIGVRDGSKNYASWPKRVGSKLFYKIINRISDVEIVPHATDFRLIDRLVIEEFKKFGEHDRITRGLIDWLGFSRAYVTFVPAERMHGAAAYSLRKLTGLAVNSFVAMSLTPLRLAGYLGLCITLLSGAAGLFVAIETYILKDPWGLNISGSVDLGLLVLFLVGIVLMALGVIALYIATIHTEVTNRPLYITKPQQTIRKKPVKREGDKHRGK